MFTIDVCSAHCKHTLHWKHSCSAHTFISVGSRTGVGSFITSLQVEHSQNALSTVGDQSVLWAVGHNSGTMEAEDKHRRWISHCSTHKRVGASLVLGGIHQRGDYLRSTCNIEKHAAVPMLHHQSISLEEWWILTYGIRPHLHGLHNLSYHHNDTYFPCMVCSCNPLCTHNSPFCNLFVNKDQWELSLQFHFKHLLGIWKLTNLNWHARRCRHMFPKGLHCDLIDCCPSWIDESVWTIICYIFTCLCCSGEVCEAHFIGVSTPRLLLPSHQQSTVIHTAIHIDNLLNSWVQGETHVHNAFVSKSTECSHLTTKQAQRGKIRVGLNVKLLKQFSEQHTQIKNTLL